MRQFIVASLFLATIALARQCDTIEGNICREFGATLENNVFNHAICSCPHTETKADGSVKINEYSCSLSDGDDEVCDGSTDADCKQFCNAVPYGHCQVSYGFQRNGYRSLCSIKHGN